MKRLRMKNKFFEEKKDFKCIKKSKKFYKSFTTINHIIRIYQNINIRDTEVRNERQGTNWILNQIKLFKIMLIK